jgi:quercetin dioxygenase-like cupin family protein
MIKQTSGELMMVQVLEGLLHFDTESRSIKLEAGQMAILHQGYSYDIEAETESVFLLTLFHENSSGI